MAEISSPDFPVEPLVVCRNPLLAAERARTREDLLVAAEGACPHPGPRAARQEAGARRGRDRPGGRRGDRPAQDSQALRPDHHEHGFQFARKAEAIAEG
ncbi:MAG: hypothetical protein U1E70_10220 [Acetobacteraceae bacterium]